MDYTKMTNEELDEMLRNITEEKATRFNKRKAESMENIKNAIAEFNKNFGPLGFIACCDGYSIEARYLKLDSETNTIYLKD